jgi:hypothetical protein
MATSQKMVIERRVVMKFSRRRFLHLTAGTAALPALPWIARAQTYPSRPITMIIPIAAGSSADVGIVPRDVEIHEAVVAG